MSLIITQKEFIRLHMESWVTAAANKYRHAIRPIYAVGAKGKPVYLGTCFFLDVAKETYVISAAHVIDEAKNADLYVGGIRDLVSVKGEFICSVSASGNRKDDQYDFAWSKVSDLFVRQVGGVKPISEQDLSKNRAPIAGRVYVAMGYPRSKNKKVNPKTKAIVPKFARYYSTGKEFEHFYKHLGLSGAHHITIDHKMQARDSEGNIVNAFYPRGMSGGPLIDLGQMVKEADLKRETPFKGVLAGVIIEKYDEYNALLSVRIDPILASIRSYSGVRVLRANHSLQARRP